MGDRSNENKVLAILIGAVENSVEGFVTIDEDHKVIFFNKAAEEIFGYSRDEVIGHDLNRIMAPRCSREHRRAVDRYVKTRVPRGIGHETELTATRKNGETFPAEIAFSVSDVNGKLYFTGIVRDLTETRAFQERIARSERLAALGQFVAEISHEIKNPLVTIGGFVRQLIRTTEDEKSLSKLNIIVDEVSRLQNLLKELKEFYMPRRLKKEAIDLWGLVEDVYVMIKEECERKKIRTEFHADKGSAIIEGDRGKLTQVFLNLFKNSVEAIGEGGKISVRCKLTGDRVEIILSDSGSGIPKKDQEKIFAPFFTTKKQGTGLGLSISKSIIDNYEGSSLTLEGQEGKGTTFKVTMPVLRNVTEEPNHQ